MTVKEDLLKEILRHGVVVGPWFNLRCKCGYVGTTVSRTGDYEHHLADALYAEVVSLGG